MENIIRINNEYISFTLIIILFFLCFSTYGQVGIGTTNPNATLDIRSSNQATPSNMDGVLIPKVDNFATSNPTASQQGMLVFATGNGSPNKGFYYWDSSTTNWILITGSSSGGSNTLDQAYDQGGLGFGKNIEATDGAVRINGEDGFLVTGSFGIGNIIDTEVSGNGTRMFFNPNKAAFRAGRVAGNQWNNSNLGTYSTALGFNATASGDYTISSGLQTTASGDYAVAFGNVTIASGLGSMAFGEFTEASGITSTAFGLGTFASGDNATAFGLGSIASEFNATAFGFSTTASGFIATTFGWSTTASGYNATAFGYQTTASGLSSTAFGHQTTASGQQFPTAFGYQTTASGFNTSTAFGYQTTASADYSTSFGSYTEASGHASTSFGESTIASGVGAMASGINNIASGIVSTVFGQENVASGVSSLAFGQDTVASSGNATAFGFNTLASAGGATAFGQNTVASGANATAFGFETVAPSFSETAIGTYNTIYTPISAGLFNNPDRLFTIGNGLNNSSRSNALTIYKSGLININDAYDMPLTDGTANQVMTTNGAGVVSFQDVNNTVFTLNQAYSQGGTGNGRIINAIFGPVEIQNNGGLIVGSFNQTHMLFVDGVNDAVGINTAVPTANLSVNGTANKPGGGTWAVFSDARLKENISNYTEGLELIKKVRPVNFSYNSKMNMLLGENHSIDRIIYQGVIAQELQKIAPDMVREINISNSINSFEKSEESEVYLEVDPNKFTYALINAVQEQQDLINNQQDEINNLKTLLKTQQNEIDEIKEFIKKF